MLDAAGAILVSLHYSMGMKTRVRLLDMALDCMHLSQARELCEAAEDYIHVVVFVDKQYANISSG